MKKIMFSDKFQLTQAVLEGRKTVTRRLVSERCLRQAEVYRHEYYADTLDALLLEEALLEFSPFKVGEVVAVAQNLKDMGYDGGDTEAIRGAIYHTPAWTNKMFVSASDCIHQIRITNVRVEQLQDISDEDCLKEGIYWDYGDYPYMATKMYKYNGKDEFIHPKAAFAALIDKVSGKGTWESNPWVYVYEFELVK